ncbi:hypothetical protein R4P64_31135 [Rhodococcus sp. IEGM 1366]|uniref:hypothetical protein n=1 Tax=Rhodococcus sp. IEGM 1366 TaxID=3082223 RepID=UPI002954CF2F|nr:hypothetical protein [Rhodococcus sp. IEGM 1366]MDV8070979.1 hypothetical protein [Rhodococcus sp. IEGM 1366]
MAATAVRDGRLSEVLAEPRAKRTWTMAPYLASSSTINYQEVTQNPLGPIGVLPGVVSATLLSTHY